MYFYKKSVILKVTFVYDQLDGNENAVWSFLLASGYLKVVDYQGYEEISEEQEPSYVLALTNYEVRIMFQSLVKGWFSEVEDEYNGFIRSAFIMALCLD